LKEIEEGINQREEDIRKEIVEFIQGVRKRQDLCASSGQQEVTEAILRRPRQRSHFTASFRASRIIHICSAPSV
jgi:hypothetical protein